jgi:hypothetical protein
MKTQNKPTCAICQNSAGVQFNIFTPRFAPFGTACVECEKTIPAHIKTVADWTPEAQASTQAATSETAARRVQFEADLAALLSSITGKARRQFEYNEQTNIPAGIVEPDRSVCMALRHGVASGWCGVNHWSCEAAIELAEAVLEDANCHSEARALRAAAESEAQKENVCNSPGWAGPAPEGVNYSAWLAFNNID